MTGDSTRTRSVLLVVLLATAAVLTTASLAGAHGGEAEKIHACVVDGSGTIRIVAPDASCRNGETALDWDGPGALDAFKAEVDARLAAVEARASHLEELASALETRATALESAVEGLGEDLGAVADRATLVEERATALEDRATELETLAGELESDLVTLAADIAALEDRAFALEERADDLEDRAFALEERADDLEDRAFALETRATDLESAVSALGGRVTTLEGDAAAITARVTDLRTAPTSGETDRVHTSRLTGLVTETTSLDPESAPGGTRSEHVITLFGGLEVGDMVVVSPPATLNEDLLFVGYDVRATTDGAQLVVYLYNPTSAAIDDGSSFWEIQYLDLTP